MIQHIALRALAVVATLLTALVFLLPNPESALPPDLEEGQELLIRDVRVFAGGEFSPPQNVLVRDGLIAEIGAGDAPHIPRVIDGSASFLLPGLIDGHTHSYGSSLADALRFGVTVHLEMFGDPAGLPRTRRARASVGAQAEADLWSSGMLATAPGGHGTQYGVPVVTLEPGDDVNAWVSARRAEGSDYIKLAYIPGARQMPSLSRDLARAVIEAAHGQGLMALAHVSTQEAAWHMVEDGIDGLVHVFADSVASDAFVAMAQSKGVFVIPTLAVIESVGGHAGSAELLEGLATPEPGQRLLSPMQQQTLGARFGGEIPGFSLATALENVRRLHAAGVPILAGSDAPNPGTAQGLSLHRELQLLVRAGLTEAEALAAATIVPATRFNLEGRGTIEVGARGDFVLVADNPLDDIGHTLSIVAVIKNGREATRVVHESGSAVRLASDLLGDFESGMTAPPGFGWTGTDDGMASGNSQVRIERVRDALDPAHGHVLRVDADVRAGFPYPWAGGAVMSTEGADLSGLDVLQFRARGTPGSYRLMGFNLGAMGIPPTVNFAVSDEWQTFTVPLSALKGLNRSAVMGFAWVAGPEVGESTLFLDDVRLVQ